MSAHQRPRLAHPPIYLRSPDGYVISCQRQEAERFGGYTILDDDEGLRMIAQQERELGRSDSDYDVDVLVRGTEMLADLTPAEAARCAGDANVTKSQIERALAVLQELQKAHG